MISFPLYDSLNTKLSSKDLTVAQKEELINSINGFDQNNKELVFALIKYHEIIKIGETTDETIPYSGTAEKSKKKGCETISWDLVKLPINLRQILYKFVLLYKKTQEEEKKREKIMNAI